MTKYIEIAIGEQIDRYKLTDISVDDFIDTIISPSIDIKSTLSDIDESEYEKSKKFELEMNVEDRFIVEHYVAKFPDKESRNSWYRMVRQHRRENEFFEL